MSRAEFNFDKLKGLMREKRLTQEELAKAVGMGAAGLNLKLNNKRDFSLTEAFAIAQVLGITDLDPYFFDVRLP